MMSGMVDGVSGVHCNVLSNTSNKLQHIHQVVDICGTRYIPAPL